MQTLDELIADAPVFAGLEQGYLKLIADCGVNARFAAGELLVREGDPADLFYLLRAGSVAIELDAPGSGPLLIETLGAGDVVGWAWLFDPYRWAFDARAREPVGAVAFDGACLRGKCEADHELGYELMRRFAASLTEDLQATRLQLLDVYSHARDD